MIEKKIYDFINLNEGEEKQEKVLETVKSNISFRGSNLWTLACAIVIACVGLNVNSTAVIIGAMLISPLMGPIVGAGFSLAIYDFELLKKSSKNLVIATLLSLTVATVYFYFSPFKDTNSELLARTSPNIYDVIIAFFGGLVGVIAITRVEKGNPIPGVAIATALMPPLCTAGHGLAISNFSYFLGAIYLYSINCFFICISTFLVLKYLNYKPIKTLNQKFEKQIRYGISILILIMIVPSFYMAYSLLQENKYNQKIEDFLTHELTNKGYTIIYKKTKHNTNPKTIELAFLSKKFSENETKSLNEKLSKYEITNTVLEIKQDPKDLKDEILNEIAIKNKTSDQKDLLINKLQKELNEYKISNTETLEEIAILFPELKNVSLGKHLTNTIDDNPKIFIVLLYESDNNAVDTKKIKKWLSQKLQTQDIELIKK
ncbi:MULTISPECIES: TIGR00341 family protein [Flavobacterium]|uniref:TIGR00341 family protein n=1 Tax=Flavobacterium columnare TaxID=996 RepID=A0A437U8Z8_9FLAO|nr:MULTISPECIES: TIGR00341 family protein [Flavobacterium]QYS88904.1 TIGR00341 family protein [Flavobacterium davisii]RVU90106.1 TIGR00341 family protein [Flavobacterium columnare]